MSTVVVLFPLRHFNEVTTNGTSAQIGFERERWKAADALRRDMKSAECEHAEKI
jgi:hypothetical protein